ncbi:MAG: DedA family protein [Thermoplasmata archaeon]
MSTVSEKFHSAFRFMKETINGNIEAKFMKYSYYIYILAIIGLIMSILGITNGYLRYFNYSNYYADEIKFFGPFYYMGYTGIFIIVAFAPLPDYLILPFYGYISSLGDFNIYLVFFVTVLSMLFLTGIEYFGGRFAGRPLLLKVLSYFRIREKDISAADDWIKNHGMFSIFIATFIPYFKNVTSLAAGTLKMKAPEFFIANFAGFSLRFSVLIYMGYASVNVFKPSFDVQYRVFLYLIGFISLLYVFIYLIMVRKKSVQNFASV